MNRYPLPAVALCAACVGGEQPTVPPATVVVPDTVPVLELTRTALVDDDIFNFITDIDIDSNGRIYVVDRDNPGARVFSPDGEFVLQIVQRRGEGPGELPGTYKIGVDAGLIYFSSSRRTLEVFETEEGRYLGAIPHPGIPLAEEVVPTPDGVAVFYYVSDRSEEAPPFPYNQTGRVAIIGLDSTVTDTGTELGVGRVPYYDYGSTWSPAPFVPATEIHVGGDGKVYFTERGDPVIRVVGGDSLSWGIPRLPASWSDRRWALKQKLELIDFWNTAVNIPELADRPAAKAPSGLPATKWWPVLGNFFLDGDRVLAQRLDLQKRSPETVWDLVVSRAVVGRLTLPKGFRPLVFRGDFLAGVTMDQDDVESVEVYRIH